MKAAVVLAPHKIVVQDVPEPVTGAYDCLCETLAVGICSGTDNNIVAGHPYHRVIFPAILGHEGVGRVAKCGSKVRHLGLGDVVTRPFNHLPSDSGFSLKFGAFAERTVVTDYRAMQEDGLPEHVWKPFTVHRVLPKDVDPLSATMLITWRETFSFLARMQLTSGERLLIIGSGANALSFADHAQNLGVQTTVIGSLVRKDAFEKKGAHFFEYTKPQPYEPQTFDSVIDTIGRSELLTPLLSALNVHAKIGVYGLDDFLNYKITKGEFQVFSGEEYDEGSAHDAVMTFVKAKKLNAWDYLSKEHVYPLEKINEAVAASRERKVFKSVVLLRS
jgi:L-iditol 2-dehydrogenase